MSSDPQNTSSFFRPDPGESSGDSDSIIEDFNSFFEKLSSLDDLQWSSDPDPDAGPGGAPSEQDVTAGQARAVGENVVAPARRPVRNPAEKGRKEDSGTIAKRAESKYAQVKQTRKRPRMEVVTSASVATPPAAAPASGAREGSVIAATPHDESFDTAKAARILKLALVSLVLFGLGLGAGWAALSLPSRFDNLIPAVKNGGQIERNNAISGSSSTLAGIGEWIWSRKSGGNKASLSQPKTGEGKTDFVAEPAPQGETSVVRGEGAVGGNADLGVLKVELPTASGDATSEDGEKDSVIPNTAGPGKNSERNSVAQVPPSGTGAGTSSNRGGFALQVGACSSYRCVESFRKLLLSQVSSGSIKVIAQPSPNGEQVIQRIRIEPLERVEAERLREALKAENPQFEGAYLVRAR